MLEADLSESDGSQEESSIRYLEADEVDDFVAWLEGDAQPFYEPLGRAMVATAEVEAALRELMAFRLGRGEAWAVLHQLEISQVLAALGAIAKRLDDDGDRAWLQDVVREANATLEPRNMLAHGLWLPLYRRGMAVVRHKRNQPDLVGRVVTVDNVLELSVSASELADRIRDRIPAPTQEEQAIRGSTSDNSE